MCIRDRVNTSSKELAVFCRRLTEQSANIFLCGADPHAPYASKTAFSHLGITELPALSLSLIHIWTMLENSSRRVMLCDHRKFQNKAFMRICDLTDVDEIICGSELGEDMIGIVNEAGMEIHIV